ncbi:MAG: transglutaminase [Bacteroidales bacterium]
MNKKGLTFGIILSIVAGCARQPAHFITDEAERRQVTADFEAKRSALPAGDLFAALDAPMSIAEKEALTFLYAYMPIGDVSDYTGAFYLDNIRASFLAREEMPWGKSIPEAIFRHFVLPVRVNNENLDESRLVFYEELRGRVKGLRLEDAVLEVNHWCHEKVIYAPSDGRTSSPLASVRTAFGRCGEESVFTVAALRAVGIPARQVYTPRWAHTDDNHAWVEAWVDGKWRFLGACEPEPVLNLAWFNAPAYRGMLMHTKVFGRYNGPEEIIENTACYTEINVIDNYAPTAKSIVSVVDGEGKPAAGATVEFKLYNYAEFYTVSRKRTDAKGQASLSAGKGDMLVWATKDGHFGFAKISFGKDAAVTLTLNKTPGDAIDLPIDIEPPVEGSIPVEVTDAQKEANARRLAAEDSIRNQYTATFYTQEKAAALAQELGLDAGRITRIMPRSYGNWREIETFLRSAKPEQRAAALALLEAISGKDLRDVPADVLTDHLQNTPAARPSPQYDRYVMNPRVSNELLSAYKAFFRKVIPEDLKAAAQKDPQALAQWVKQTVATDNALNPQRIPILPAGVWKSRVADAHSRDIFFVAVARSLGIPARIERVAGKVQYLTGNDRWVNVDFDDAATPAIPKRGKAVATYKPIRALDDPKYSSHFTIARINPDGTLRTLNFEAGAQVDMGGGDTWSRLLKRPLAMDEGHYLLVTGMRMAKGNVLAQLKSFRILPGQTTAINLTMRENTEDIQVIGNIDAEAKFRLAESGEEKSILSVAGRGYFVAAILGARQEPTNHAMRDIAAFGKDFEDWGRSIICLFAGEADWRRYDAKEFAALPSTIVYGVDTDKRIAGMLVDAMHLSGAGVLPIFVIADTFGRVVFVSQGYTIGLGEQLLQTIRKL